MFDHAAGPRRAGERRHGTSGIPVLAPLAKRRLAARDLAEYVEFFTGNYSAEGDMRSKVAKWWDLEALGVQISEFMDYYRNSLTDWTTYVGEDPAAALAASSEELRRDAFRYYVPMLTLWRRLPYRDPGLPLEYLNR